MKNNIFSYKPLKRKKIVKKLQKCSNTQPKRGTQLKKSPAKKTQNSPATKTRKSHNLFDVTYQNQRKWENFPKLNGLLRISEL